MSAKPRKKQNEATKHATATPQEARAREKERVDDEAVSDTVNADDKAANDGSKSVLPGPPLPPDVQRKLRDSEQK